MAQQTHYFLALALPGHIKELLANWRKELDGKLPFKTWVHPEDYHITLAFLGNASFREVADVKKVISKLVEKHHTFQLQINGVGTFGQKSSPRIFWAGVNDSDSLHNLQSDVFHVCTEIGFSLDKRPFHPHITMARKWTGEELFPSEKLDEIVHPIEELCQFTAEHVVLYQTHLNRSPKYQPLAIFPLMKG